MQRIIFILLFIVSIHKTYCDVPESPAIPLINLQDTVVFDLSQAACASGFMEFPVYINSDEAVYALDFSMKFDPANMSFITAINLKPYLVTSAWFNASDSTLRFSSYSMQPVDINTPLVKLKFNLPSAQINFATFDSVYTLLNGDDCSKKFIDPVLPTSINVSGAPVIELGDSLLLSVDYIPGINYLWSTGETTAIIYVNFAGTYTVTVEAIMGCISQSEIYIDYISPLPIELIVFEGEQYAKEIELLWITATEQYNDYFEIQRMDSGQNWQTLGRIDGAGNSTHNNQYIFFDTNPDIGANFYRLMQVDFDGAISYSSIVKVFYDIDNQNQLFTAFPSPLKSGDPLHFEIPSNFVEHSARMVITDYTGKVILSRFVDTTNAVSGKMLVTIDLPENVAFGLYSATILTEAKSATCRFILQ